MAPSERGADRGDVRSKLASLAARERLSVALAAVAFLFALTTASALGATTYAASCDGVNLRTGAGTTYAIKGSISTGTQVSVVATVSGSSWSATCAGKAVSGASWYRISAVNGTSVATKYGVTYVYGATGLFKAVVVPTPSPTAVSSGSPDPSASPGPSASPSPSPSPGPTILSDLVTFYGRGYGHGVGMSQAGAEGRALAGQTATTILAHYYKGTTIGAASNSTVRVLVLSGWAATSASPLRLYGLSGSWTIDGITTVFPASAQARLTPTVVSPTSTTWRLTVLASDGVTRLYDKASGTSLRMRPASSGAVLRLYSKPSAYDRYRGVLHILASASAPTVRVVNEVPLEAYLRGVVPAEMSSSAPAEALKAQAIASRSYAVRRLHPSTGSYDIYDDTRSQVYHGVLAELAATNSAIGATAGQVLKSGSVVANAMYHSTGGGATESNQNVWTSSTGAIVDSPISYLQGSSDRAPDGSAYDKLGSYATWHTATYTLAQLQAFFAADSRTNVGAVVALDLRNVGVSREISVTLIGATGTKKTVSSAIFISVFNAHRPSTDAPMRDTLFGLAPIP
jgi:SpoIID/LytB domain protein